MRCDSGFKLWSCLCQFPQETEPFNFKNIWGRDGSVQLSYLHTLAFFSKADKKMFRTIKAIKSKLSQSPYVSNCIYYGTLFCAAEVSQQVVIKKYLPWSQVLWIGMDTDSISELLWVSFIHNIVYKNTTILESFFIYLILFGVLFILQGSFPV